MKSLEVGDEAAYDEWESKHMECWEYALLVTYHKSTMM